MEYRQTLDFLYNSLPDYQQIGSDAYKPGLDRTLAFNDYLGRPDLHFGTIHVAGTNGKGSVSHILASVLQSAHYCVGLYTSPHLKDFRERIRVDGEQITENEVVRFVESNKPKMLDLRLSFFEMTVGMAFDHFARKGVEVAIVETGLGGRLDSTNIVNPMLSVITNVGLDHTSMLGDTLPKIAAEKAGIIKRGVPVVIGERNTQTDDVFIAKAREMDAPIFFAEDMFSAEECGMLPAGRRMTVTRKRDGLTYDITLDLQGDYQLKNIVTVFAALEILHKHTPLSISRRAAAEGCATAAVATSLMGRWQTLSLEPLTVCDTGHNAHGLQMVVDQIRRQRRNRLLMVLGFADDKDISSILPLLPADATYIFTQAASRRAMPASEIAEKAKAYGFEGIVTGSVAEAMAVAHNMASSDDMIFVGGSTFVVAEVL